MRRRSFLASGSGTTTQRALQVTHDPMPISRWYLVLCLTRTGPPLATIEVTNFPQPGHMSGISVTLSSRRSLERSDISIVLEEALPLRNDRFYTQVKRNPRIRLQTFVVCEVVISCSIAVKGELCGAQAHDIYNKATLRQAASSSRRGGRVGQHFVARSTRKTKASQRDLYEPHP